MSSTSVLEAYDQSLQILISAIETKLVELKALPSSREKKTHVVENLIKEISALFNEADSATKQMNMEIKSNDAATRKLLSPKLDVIIKRVDELRREYARSKEQSQRSCLIGDRSISDRAQVLNSNEK